MSQRHSAETIVGAAMLLLCGTGLTILTHVFGVNSGMMSQMAAGVGPVAIVLGIGMAVHGQSMPPNRISVPARAWGMLGSAVSIAHLWWIGYFAVPTPGRKFAQLIIPIALIVAWLLPARAYGDEAPESQPAADPMAPHAPPATE
jgi:hypothetical protein